MPSCPLRRWRSVVFGSVGGTLRHGLRVRALARPERRAEVRVGGTWWLIPLSKWVITPVISGLTLLIPFITGVITHLLSGMSHQVDLGSFSLLERGCHMSHEQNTLVNWLRKRGILSYLVKTGDYFLAHSRETYQPTSIMRWDRGIFNGSHDSGNEPGINISSHEWRTKRHTTEWHPAVISYCTVQFCSLFSRVTCAFIILMMLLLLVESCAAGFATERP